MTAKPEVLYVVHVAVDRSRADEWLRWMDAVHVPEVMQTGCFVRATLARDQAADTPGRRAYRASYEARSAQALAEYQSVFAARLQADHTARYEGCFEARRELLEVVGTYAS